MGLSRRKFVKWGLFSSAALAFSGYSLSRLLIDDPFAVVNAREALFYNQLNSGNVQCLLCNQACIIQPGTTGLCRVRFNRGGMLYSAVYARPAAIVVDPVEKEPLYHFIPGSNALSVGTAGCSFSCLFCQNWQLSQRSPEDFEDHYNYTPESLVQLAQNRGVQLISFTFNEPTVSFEYLYDTALIAREKGIKLIVHTNAYLSPEPLKMLLPLISAFTVDLKGFSEEYYKDVCGGGLSAVLNNLITIRNSNVWLEVVNLVVPGLNDKEQVITGMCKWLANNLGNDTPLHFSRFYPAYRLADLSPTPVQSLEKAHTIAKENGLNYVTLGNTPGHPFNSTYCPKCGSLVIERMHVAIERVNLENGCCINCGETIAGIWS
jgi:pyruvate formate lyase activating enzyme